MKTGSASELAGWLEESRLWAEASLERALAEVGHGPVRLVEALRYAVLGGGKRLRPALVRLVAEELGGSLEDTWRSACAVELVHAYSLVHDDLPCMDDDELRRGRPTCHVVYGEALAVLAGDALQAAAFELAAAAPEGAEQVRVLAVAAGPDGMVGGQVLDLESSARSESAKREPTVDEAEVRAIHARKTGALFGAAAELGALCARTGGESRRAARAFGLALGRLFQAVDDVLDVTGDARTLGKTPGKDAAGAKATLVAALGLAGARAEVERLAEAAERAAREALGGASRAPALVRHLAERRS